MLDRARVRELFSAALLLPPEDIGAFLTGACGGDSELRAEVESLLAAQQRRPHFLASPTAEVIGSGGEEGPGTRIGAYTLIEEVGQGGFGVVYAAEQQEPIQRRVAIKVVKPGMDTRAIIKRFESERRALAMMGHPGIASVIDAGTTASGRPYFVMEFVDGDPINVFAEKHRLSVAERLDLVIQVCDAMQHAHTKGVIHRDIKPANVLVSMQDGRPHVKVIDFGIAVAVDHAQAGRTLYTQVGHFVGTPEYMSPEQAGGVRDIDTRTDVYGIGVLLYELLTGETPFVAEELRAAAYSEVQRIIREVDPPKPSTRVARSPRSAELCVISGMDREGLRAQVAGDLDWIAMKAMEKDRARRYETPRAIATDLLSHIEGRPVMAAPPSARYRLMKFVRRHRVGVAAGTAVVVALLLGMIGTTVGLVSARRASEQARANAERATREAEQATAMNEFMRGVLTSVEPQNQGADVRLIEVLSGASAAAPERFAGHPILEAQVHGMLSEVYDKLSMWGESRTECEQAAALYRAYAGPDDPFTLRAERQAIGAALNMGKAKEVEPLIQELLPRIERVLGPDDLTTLEARRALATVHALRGRLEEAESIFLSLREHPRLADDDRMQVRILISLIRLNRSKPEIKDRNERLAHGAQVVLLGRECVERAVRAHGPTSHVTVNAKVHLALALDAHEDFGEAAGMYRAVLEETRERLGDCHQVRASAMFGLAKALARQGQIDEPSELVLRSIECERKAPQIHSVNLLGSLSESLHFLERSGHAAEGEAIARELAAGMARFGDRASPFEAEMFRAVFVSMSGRLEEAGALFEPLRKRAEESGSPHAQACVERVYAGHLMRLGRFDESERSLNRCAELQGSVIHGTYDPLPDDIVYAYINLYRAWQLPDKVREYEQLREQAFGIKPRRP